MTSSHLFRGLLLVALVAGAAACSKQSPSVNVASAAPAKPAPVAAALPMLGPAPAWTLKDVDGNLVSSEQFKGKVLVVDFWATWCGPCRMEIPGYVELQKKYGKDRLVIVGVSVDQAGPGVVKTFIEKQGINYQMVMNDDAVTGAFGAMDAIPTTFLIDRNGQVRDRKVGVEPTEDYEKKIVSLLN